MKPLFYGWQSKTVRSIGFRYILASPACRRMTAVNFMK
ncbi:hypothetical protein AVDCRST_MAG84-7137 [uncultured Microcoleus sp.]|uniref:Uncharacterized protein n=1 Tax=uncultured Microcoleus sp. TaxID=259945 RepID=A0A6J4PRZ2_9CYAN|nr:hypothetical protein AVDCRST_MAG84-7137 [uncultured Microcoleus sp.]